MTIDDRLSILEALWSVWAERGRAMTEDQWRQPTRLGDWDIRSLYAHVASWPEILAGVTGRVRDAEPVAPTAAALLRYINAPGGLAHSERNRVAENARADGARQSTAQLIDAFAGTGSRAIAAARQLGPVVVDYFGALLPLAEAVSIGIVEATVHLLDLQRALGREPDVPAGGLAHTTAVLVEMAPAVDFIEAATGRSTEALFPLLS
ncbi:maleylpyruvate isomerase family mycothiol-dependent enzyme [Nucisporomicrobium flavum]|uniref:maleylpyruvate isomerase family mycothiol-dependent enzyme n=1 Tax=Nucisporomicrobium flavum TaxID=2785915 RepID=UPI003C2FC6EE